MISFPRQKPSRIVIELEPDWGRRVRYKLAVQLVHDRQGNVVVDEVDETVPGSLASEFIFNYLQFVQS